MHVAFFVHDFHREIGHSNAMIEVFRHWQGPQITKLKIVAFTFTPAEILMPELADRVEFIRVPFPRLKPFIIKVIWYQLMAWIYSCFKLQNYFKIGIGTAALNVNLVNVQFIHSQWQKDYLAITRKAGLGRYLYKKFLYAYLIWCENVLYRRKDVLFACCAVFIERFIAQHFGVETTRTITSYSGIDLDRFAPQEKEREQIWKELCSSYSLLETLDLNRPIALFVGAFERKGLPSILAQRTAGMQLIVVGQSELDEAIYEKDQLGSDKIYIIKHTKKIDAFYALCDVFLFPSLYDPFGLVVFEAFAMGLTIYVSSAGVGAAEILQGQEDVHLIDPNGHFSFENFSILTKEEKLARRARRLVHLRRFSWEKTADCYQQLLQKNHRDEEYFGIIK